MADPRYFLATMYYNGSGGLDKNVKETVGLLQYVANIKNHFCSGIVEQCRIDGQRMLADLTDNGEGGLSKNPLEAARWRWRARKNQGKVLSEAQETQLVADLAAKAKAKEKAASSSSGGHIGSL